MTTLNVPNISRKKPVPCNFSSNSFRVFGEELKNKAIYHRPPEIPQSFIQTYDKTLNLPSWYYNSHYEPERNIRDRNRCEVTYLRRNVRTLNHPVCYVPSAQESEHWWPSRVPSETRPNPSSTKDTTMRSDYNWTEEHQSYGSSRHKYSNDKAALGAVPVNHLPEKTGRQRFFKEMISYDHQYDSRKMNNYPIRSTRHGAYVSQPITAHQATRLLNHPENWRADGQVMPPTSSHSEPCGTSTAVLPGIGEHNCRLTDQPNFKRRSNFDIAPRSNLNVRVREYVPTLPTQMNEEHTKAPNLTHTEISEPKAEPPTAVDIPANAE
ncbi:C2orf73 [Bugula neritina]|uniref:C2orf73 n=1 Tax=Bugula neritina TaxID=10212 RepID=A0A7J7J8X2_BUGNE|nr:C2orf73 [Bugula neritina]